MGRRKVTNDDIAKVLREMAAAYEAKEVSFKPQAFERAAHSIAALEESIAAIYKKEGSRGLEDIPGVGEGIAERIEEYIKTGTIKEYKKLKKQMPRELDEIVRVEGVGPKTAKKLFDKLGISTLKQLEKAARGGKIRKLEGFGKKSEEEILHSIEFLKKTGKRHILGYILPTIRELEEKLKEHKGVNKVVVAGSVRRWQETIGDVDILVTSKKPKAVMDFFVKLPMVDEILAHGPTKVMVRLKNPASGGAGLEVDVRAVKPESFGAALQYFTGDKQHNVEVRKIAIDKGYKLNEYGLFKGKRRVAGKTEEEIYKKLGMATPPPEIRTASGEIKAAQKKKLPKLINYDDLKGDLQIQTDWTDGQHSMEEMARAAAERGLEYIVITDHTKSLAMTGGADEKQLRRQMKAIDKLNKKLKSKGVKIKILKGAEVNIMKDGSLDIKDEVLAELDVVGVAVHSHFKLSRAEQTKRVVTAMENPNADILFHPTGRVVNRREAINLDMDEVIKAAKKTKTVLEIDAYPDRLDLRDEYIRKAVEAGVKLSIDTDAHAIGHLDYLELGIAQARRGWATKRDIINAWPVKKMLRMLK